MLATGGLLGSRRGTWGGIGMGTVGGALMGAGIGTMIAPGIGTLIGAGVGAAVGFGIGVGEKIAGVESKENQAKRLAKEIYGLSIDGSTAKALANMADQNYGGSVGTAMRSQEARSLLQLYANSVGQKATMWLDTPRSAGLVQQGGALSQASTYYNGVGYNYESYLPNASPGATIPTSSPYSNGAGTVVLNINGSSAADVLEGRASQAVFGGSNRTASASTMLNPSILPY